MQVGGMVAFLEGGIVDRPERDGANVNDGQTGRETERQGYGEREGDRQADREMERQRQSQGQGQQNRKRD